MFTGRQDYRKIRLLCVALFSAMRDAKLNPIWYLANGLFEKTPLEVRDNKAIFIDSIADDMSQFKFDKVHDLCQKYCDKTLVIMHHGKIGYDVCLDRFGVTPSLM